MAASNNAGLSEAEYADYREAFQMFDQDNNGTISRSELKGVMESLGHKATDREIEDMVNEVDSDGNGVIDFEEFVNMMERQRQAPAEAPSADEVRREFGRLDVDQDGHLSQRELLECVAALKYDVDDAAVQAALAEAGVVGGAPGALYSEDAVRGVVAKLPASADSGLREAFNVFDKDGNGSISRSELSAVMQSLGEKLSDQEIESMFKEADIDKDGNISYEEFTKMMGSK